MTYLVLDDDKMNDRDRTTDKRNYALLVESALNALEREGYTLINGVYVGEETGMVYFLHAEPERSGDAYIR